MKDYLLNFALLTLIEFAAYSVQCVKCFYCVRLVSARNHSDWSFTFGRNVMLSRQCDSN